MLYSSAANSVSASGTNRPKSSNSQPNTCPAKKNAAKWDATMAPKNICRQERVVAGHDRIPFPRSDRAPSHNFCQLQWSIARHCTRCLRLSCGSTGCPTQLSRMALEGSIIPIVEDMFKEGLALHGSAPGVDPALLATTAAWAVFGAARRWFQTPDRISAEEMAARIE